VPPALLRLGALVIRGLRGSFARGEEAIYQREHAADGDFEETLYPFDSAIMAEQVDPDDGSEDLEEE
jgi:hypothetical protein